MLASNRFEVRVCDMLGFNQPVSFGNTFTWEQAQKVVDSMVGYSGKLILIARYVDGRIVRMEHF